MLTALRQGRVAGLRVTVACARSLDDVPYDVYLIDLSPPEQSGTSGGRFDEVPYLECLEPVLDAAGGPPSWVVEIARTHSSARDGLGEAHLSVVLALGAAPSSDGTMPDLTPVVTSALARMADALAGGGSTALGRDDAVAAGVAAVAHAFPDVDARTLTLTDEEHHATEGRWSLGLTLPGIARFQVQLGLVPGAAASAHVRHLPVGEVVDSVGT